VTPAGTRRYEVTASRPGEALAAARGVAAVRDVTLFGTALHVLVDEGLRPGALLAAVAPGDAAAEARPIAPSLEDVFVIVSRSRGEAAA
jgi:hypothetical protein